jgi:glyoxylase-like metal-dependent hydrolase (beta-lactamase superfamily II)
VTLGFEAAEEIGIHPITLPTGFPVGPVNSYLIEDDPLTLVDAGPNSATTFEALEDGLAALGHRVRDVGLILITHQHLDHTGLVGTLARRSGAEVAALDLLKPWLADYERAMSRQQRYTDEIMGANGVPRDIRLVVRAIGRRTRVSGAPATVTMPLAADQQLRLRDRTLTVMHRPGHSPSDTVYFDADRRTMIAGDHLLRHISSNPVISTPLAGELYPRPQTLVTYIASMRATAREPAKLVLTGHGQPIHDHRGLISRRLTMHQQRCDHLYDLIAERPHSAYELALELWGDEAPKQAALTISEVLGHVDLLLNDGRVSETTGPEGTIRFVATEQLADDPSVTTPGTRSRA